LSVEIVEPDVSIVERNRNQAVVGHGQPVELKSDTKLRTKNIS
jgi:hypothetical protein